MELTSINGLLEEINYLKKKAMLLDEILSYYDNETMTFDIPEKWKDLNRFSADTLKGIPKSPRHSVNKKISELLPYSEHAPYVNWDKVSETAADLKIK